MTISSHDSLSPRKNNSLRLLQTVFFVGVGGLQLWPDIFLGKGFLPAGLRKSQGSVECKSLLTRNRNYMQTV